MNGKISVVINTLNEQKNIERAIRSVEFADEILVCDMLSDDNTPVIAKKLGATVFFHKRVGFVEPARNFAISKATHEWILILDADEEVPPSLADKLMEIASSNGVVTFVEIPRKNIIFGKWMKASMWWPDYNIRFFKVGHVSWSDKIHRPPTSDGQGLKLTSDESHAIIHHHYDSLSQYITRMDRYTDVQAMELVKDGYKFQWSDIIKKPLGEFLSRYFANRGFDDGLHGLALGLLQALSHLVLYLKVWQVEEFKDQNFSLGEVKKQASEVGKEINYWFKYANLSKHPLKSMLQRAKNRLTS